jgi:hypothetical protein
VRGVGDERLVAELGQAHGVALGERVRLGQDGDQRLATQQPHDEIPGVHRRTEETDVQGTILQGTDLDGGQHLPLEVEIDPGEVRAEHPSEGRQQLVGRRTGEPDGEPPDLTGGRPARLDTRGRDRGEDGSRPLEVDLPGRGELDLPRRADQQRHPQVVLELLDLLRERRLGDVQARRGPSEVALLAHRDEVAEVP